jgi:hypothetical protein
VGDGKYQLSFIVGPITVTGKIMIRDEQALSRSNPPITENRFLLTAIPSLGSIPKITHMYTNQRYIRKINLKTANITVERNI